MIYISKILKKNQKTFKISFFSFKKKKTNEIVFMKIHPLKKAAKNRPFDSKNNVEQGFFLLFFIIFQFLFFNFFNFLFFFIFFFILFFDSFFNFGYIQK